ncbi:helix-turn-helix transcriptional regulator [Novosphingobium sp. KN65.2]|uniref:helix-turn-helix domain-containing protein n=1 Tax=Novosphingobium sp. KN65.2 TaxID=1478134 RepID=UPI0005EA49A8|nr:helix-turn-helix transcriptional regulator [Novosphingobium sp. KN65.2]CDO37264.1 hypothetical protein SPHV1_310037 [Novosphingobium sp. KN65.2]
MANSGFDVDAKEYDRTILKSEMVSLFWSVISEKKKGPEGYTLQRLADTLGVNKSVISRWFNGTPNWEMNTVSDLASALGVELQISAKDYSSEKVYTSHGIVYPDSTRSSLDVISIPRSESQTPRVSVTVFETDGIAA